MKTFRYQLLALAAFLLLPFAQARVDFGLHEFPVSEFRDADELAQNCSAPAASSFWCDHLDATLTRVPTKGADYFFNEAGEVVAVFGKQQKGQALGNYNLGSGQNLVPQGARIPGGAILIDGEYLEIEEAQASWRQISDTSIEGTFRIRAGGLDIERTVLVSNITHTLEMVVEAVRDDAAEAVGGDAAGGEGGENAGGVAGQGEGQAGAQGEDQQVVQVAFQGIARQDTPTIKIGQGDSFSLNPISQPVPNALYASLQTNNRNSGYAIVMRPSGTAEENLLSLDEATTTAADGSPSPLAAQALPNSTIAMQQQLGGETGDSARLTMEIYTGPNELVRYSQEGYADLPGLFNPNILGRMSIGLIWILRYIHEYVNSWGLSIIVLTLLFRALIWPLIATQTKSMLGMQQLQPKIQALQKKYKDNREKLTEETMKLYREAGVNPAGGCLPIILQMPLFIILWRVFVNFEFNEGFAWLPDLGQPDPFYILPALYVLVMVAQSYFATRGNQQQFRQQMLINVVFVFIMVGFPAGVILYFVVSMLVQVFQYWLLSRNKPQPLAAKQGKG